MPDTIDLSGTPCEEECAQIGRYPEATNHSYHEAKAYRAALIAVHGLPPEGYTLRVRANPHDFGTYHTVELVCPAEASLENCEYENAVEDGLSHWRQALMPAPYNHERSPPTAICAGSPSDEAIRRAIIASRPDHHGAFALDSFRDVHTRLRAAFPAQATAADITIAIIHAQEGATIQ